MPCWPLRIPCDRLTKVRNCIVPLGLLYSVVRRLMHPKSSLWPRSGRASPLLGASVCKMCVVEVGKGAPSVIETGGWFSSFRIVVASSDGIAFGVIEEVCTVGFFYKACQT